jgi:hypothetical protein
MREVQERLRLFTYQMEARGSGASVLEKHRGRIEARARAHLEALGRALLDPVLAGSGNPTRVRISPYGSLFRVPFHALLWRGVPLIESAQVVLDPFPGWTPLHKPPLRAGACVVGYSGNSAAGSIGMEARLVAETLGAGGVQVELHMGESANLECITSAAVNRALLHLAGHAVYRASHPEFSALRLAGGWLTVSDLAALPLGGVSVVLSACETGPRGAVAGSEMLGLVRGLIRAGAASVVASLWRVDDRSTLAFMRDMYATWSRGGCLGAALRDVQRLRSERHSDPYLWAPFCLIGLADVSWPGRSLETA